MTAIIEAIVWLCAGAAAGIAIGAWATKATMKLADEAIDELLAANRRLREHIAMLEKRRERDSADWWQEN